VSLSPPSSLQRLSTTSPSKPSGLEISLSGFSKSFVPLGSTRFGRPFATTKTEGDPVHAVGPVDLSVGEGSITVLIGPSGCGKTTLLKAVGGLLEPTTGTITIGDQTPIEARRSKLFGLVPQAPTLLSWRTVRQNVNLLNEVGVKASTSHTSNRAATSQPMSSTELDALLIEVGLGGFEQAKPRQLSGGMQQRVALVRAFATGAPVLLLDEPFAALDEFTRADMRQLLLKLWAKRKPTIIFTTHSLEEAVLLADQIVVMAPRPGRIVAEIPVGLARPSAAGIEDTDEFNVHVRSVRSALRQAILSAQVIS
jgi:NitT/TauT family transport system ATP-binding protein